MREKLNNNSNYLTLSTYLLFNNEYLDLMILLCVMYNLKNKRKGSTLDEIMLYYLIIVSEVEISILEKQININTTACKYDTDTKYIESINKIKKNLNVLLAEGYLDFCSCENEEFHKDAFEALKSLAPQIKDENYVAYLLSYPDGEEEEEE